jgi:hypothetical protein
MCSFNPFLTRAGLAADAAAPRITEAMGLQCFVLVLVTYAEFCVFNIEVIPPFSSK